MSNQHNNGISLPTADLVFTRNLFRNILQNIGLKNESIIQVATEVV